MINTFAKGILERKSIRFSLFYIVKKQPVQTIDTELKKLPQENLQESFIYFANCLGGVFSLRSSNLYPSALSLSIIVGSASCTNAVFGISCISKME